MFELLGTYLQWCAVASQCQCQLHQLFVRFATQPAKDTRQYPCRRGSSSRLNAQIMFPGAVFQNNFGNRAPRLKLLIKI